MKPTNVLRFIDIKTKESKARYIWRWSGCSYEILAERANIPKKTAKKWWRRFNQGKKE